MENRSKRPKPSLLQISNCCLSEYIILYVYELQSRTASRPRTHVYNIVIILLCDGGVGFTVRPIDRLWRRTRRIHHNDDNPHNVRLIRSLYVYVYSCSGAVVYLGFCQGVPQRECASADISH